MSGHVPNRQLSGRRLQRDPHPESERSVHIRDILALLVFSLTRRGLSWAAGDPFGRPHMSAWQRFQAFPKAVRVWCWILLAGVIYLLANTIYLSSESPYYYTTSGGVTLSGLDASQMNNICQSPAGRIMQLVHPSSVTTCNNAQGIEQQKAISA